MYGLVGDREVVSSILYNEPHLYFFLEDSVEEPERLSKRDFSKHFLENDKVLVPLELVK